MNVKNPIPTTQTPTNKKTVSLSSESGKSIMIIPMIISKIPTIKVETLLVTRFFIIVIL